MRRPGLHVLVALAIVPLAAAGCGDDEERADSSTEPSTQTEPRDVVTEVQTSDIPATTVTVPEDEVEPSPEEQPGGAGDEEPAQSQALFTGRGGRITPRVVRVPPFISIRVELRSADGGEYALDCGGRKLRVDGDIETASTRIAGQRPQERVRCAPIGNHNGVVVSASAEPGP